MPTSETGLIAGATGSDLSAHEPVTRAAMPLAVGIALVGAFTGVSSAVQPGAILDWTSVSGVEFVINQPHSAWPPPESVMTYELPPPDVRALKGRAGLTWQQLADVMGVKPRALHLWAAGGGLTQVHQERLGDLSRLVDSLYVGSPEAVRIELMSGTSGGQSLLDRLRHGAMPSALVTLAPWRVRARRAATTNVVAASSDGIVDEDYLFLLYTDQGGVRRFADRAAALLDDPSTTRQIWESFVDSQFACVTQASQAEQFLDTDIDTAPDANEVAPLFDPFNLGVSLGVGAISGRAYSAGA